MEIVIKAVLIKNLENIDMFQIKVNSLKYPIVKQKLLEQKLLATNITKELLKEGKITSISKPINKQLQPHLNKLNIAKKTIKNSLRELYDFFK